MDVFVTNDVTERGNCADRTDERKAVVAGEWDILHSLAALDGLGEPQIEVDPADSVEVKIFEIPPTDEALWIDFAVGSRDEAGTAQSGKHVQ